MLTFYHAPWSRGSSIFWLLEELGVPYDMKLDRHPRARRRARGISFHPAEQESAGHRARRHSGDGARCDRALPDRNFSRNGPCAEAGRQDRAPFLSWLVYSDASSIRCSPSGRTAGTMSRAASRSAPTTTWYAIWKRRCPRGPTSPAIDFTAADTQIGAGISYASNVLGQLTDRPVLKEYFDRLTERPGYQRYAKKDFELAQDAGMANG